MSGSAGGSMMGANFTFSVNHLKVLFILPEFDSETSGGISTYYRELLKENHFESSWQITVLQGGAFDSRETTSSWEGIVIHHMKTELFEKYTALFKHYSLFPELQKHLAAAWAMYEQASRITARFDCVICTDWGFGFVPWIVNNTLPVIVHLHGSCGQIDHFEPRKGLELLSQLFLHIESNVLEHASALVTHSRQNINFWQKKFIAEREIKLVPPVVNLPETCLHGGGIKGRKNGLVIGRIQYWKGAILLCQAISLLTDDDKKDLKIYWIGRDTYYHNAGMSMSAYLYEQFSSIWGKIIIPIGVKRKKEIADFMEQVAWGVVPSIWDMFNLSALEHLSFGKRLICSKKAGVADFLTTGESIVICDDAPESLAASIKQIMNVHSSDEDSIRSKGRQFIHEEFNGRKVQFMHLELIRKAIEEFGSRDFKQNFDWLYPMKTSSMAKDDPFFAIMNSLSLKKLSKYVFGRVAKKFR